MFNNQPRLVMIWKQKRRYSTTGPLMVPRTYKVKKITYPSHRHDATKRRKWKSEKIHISRTVSNAAECKRMRKVAKSAEVKGAEMSSLTQRARNESLI